MKKIHSCSFLTLLIALIYACGTEGYKATEAQNDLRSFSSDSFQSDAIQWHAGFNEEDLPVNEYLNERLEPIRENFKRIQSISHWSSIDAQNLWETTEGGEAKYYFQNGKLEKIATRRFGETFQQLTEYYLMNGQLSFVFEKSIAYNRPMYYDAKAMKENNDTEAFDVDEAEISEDRSYFENNKLLHKIESGDCGAPFASEYLIEEEKRILGDFNTLIKHIHSEVKSLE